MTLHSWSTSETWLYILDVVESIKVYKGVGDQLYYAEVYDCINGKIKFHVFTAVTFEELVLSIAEKV